MSIILRGFFRCSCGKVHCYGGLTDRSVCVCGQCLNCIAPLWTCFKKEHNAYGM